MSNDKIKLSSNLKGSSINWFNTPMQNRIDRGTTAKFMESICEDPEEKEKRIKIYKDRVGEINGVDPDEERDNLQNN